MDATLAGREFRAPSGTRSAGRRPAADDGVLARLQLLHAIDDALLSAESVGAVAAAAVRLLRDIAGVDRAALWAWVPEAAEGRLLAAAPPADPPMAGRAAPIQDVPATLIERLVRGELVQLDRAVDGEVMTALPTLPAWARTWCAIPLVDGDGALGAITLVQRRGSPIDPVTIAVLRSAGAHVATALRRVQLREQLRIASERTAVILESSPIGILIAG
ncbi:MAG: GAF domain-containing protein [Chloroflexota bacterium]